MGSTLAFTWGLEAIGSSKLYKYRALAELAKKEMDAAILAGNDFLYDMQKKAIRSFPNLTRDEIVSQMVNGIEAGRFCARSKPCFVISAAGGKMARSGHHKATFFLTRRNSLGRTPRSGSWESALSLI